MSLPLEIGISVAMLSNLPLQNLAFQGGDVVAAKTSIVEKT